MLGGTIGTEMVTRRTVIAGAASLAAGGSAALAQQESFGSESLHRGRATAPVLLNGEGPFHFIVDTAANCSVVSSDLAAPLRLEAMGDIGMHTLVAREVVPAVRAARVTSGTLDASDVRLAVGQRSAMAGLDGLLGCDLLVESKVILNFRGRQRVRIARSAASPRGVLGRFDPETPFVITGERRFGNLLIIPARAGRAAAVAVIDSGAEGTILNRPAAQAGRAMPLVPTDGRTRRRIQSPSGEATAGEAMLLPVLRFAGALVSNLAVAVGDFHTFRFLGFQDQPAMLIGLDVLRLFEAVHIDLKRAELSLHV